MRALIIFAVGLAVVIVGTSARRIVGGSLTTIDRYPFAAALLFSPTSSGVFHHSCGGSIINNRSILTAAHCFSFFSPSQLRARVGSTYWNSGGIVVTIKRLIRHGSFIPGTLDSDIAIIRINGAFPFNRNIGAGSIAGANYNLHDNVPVRVAGWGSTSWEGPGSVQLRHVQVWVVNQSVCRSRYAELRETVTENMMCSGYLDVGGRDGCQGDSGGPVLHNGIIVGITSWGYQCAHPRYPGVNVRVSRYTTWIDHNK